MDLNTFLLLFIVAGQLVTLSILSTMGRRVKHHHKPCENNDPQAEQERQEIFDVLLKLKTDIESTV